VIKSTDKQRREKLMKIGVLARAGGLALGATTVAAALVLAGTPAHAVTARSAAGASTSAVAAPAATPRTLKEGMSGADVLALQHRLWSLHYWTGAINGRFTHDTTEAVWAFQAINGLTMDGAVGPVTRNALARPHAYKPHNSSVATRIEVNINAKVQVLVYYKNHALALISHVSSAGGYYFCDSHGCGYARTPTGTYTANIFMAGWITVPLGKMYNPVFFIGTSFAIHGDTSVPVYPASHPPRGQRLRMSPRGPGSL
jgi:hypothetical protein